MHEDPESRRINILMVDDQPAKLLSYEAVLSDLGENLIRAGSAREALVQMLQNDIAVVLLDVSMPELDGFELAAMIRQHPRFERTAIIFISAILQTDIDRLRGYESGAVDYIPVPVVPELLRAKVRVFVDLYRTTRDLERANLELEERVASRTAELEASAARLRESEVQLQRLLEQEQAARAEAEAARAAAQAASRAKDEFLALVSHELRTPLNAMLGWARMLRTQALDGTTARRAVEVIDRNARSQAQLVEDLLDFSRIVSRRLRLDLRDVELGPLIEAALEVVRPTSEAKGVVIRTELDPAAGLVSGDPARLEQIFANLLSNAVKFTPIGGHVDVRLTRDGNEVLVVVVDDGQGIDAAFLPHVFEQFRQADVTSTRRHGGLGLGLSIVHYLVELHRGSIEAYSEGSGRGARFEVRFPLLETGGEAVRVHPTLVAASESQAFELHPELHGIVALVVDDDEDSREMISIVLRRHGVDVETAGSAAEAWERLEQRIPDVLISDIAMPGEDGCALVERVRSLPPERGGVVPAIALTAHSRAEDRVRVLAAGYQIHVPKPVEPAELVAVLISVLGRYEGRVREG